MITRARPTSIVSAFIDARRVSTRAIAMDGGEALVDRSLDDQK
jgi:hypothetical protein